MSAEGATAQETILQVVRGERPWTDLRTLGIDIRLEGNRCDTKNPQHLSATADVHDIARGFMAYRQDPRALREWGFIMEALDVDLDVEQHPAGDLVLNALWDASFGNPIEADVWQTIEDLARTNGDGV
jgi:hypothetical protein